MLVCKVVEPLWSKRCRDGLEVGRHKVNSAQRRIPIPADRAPGAQKMAIAGTVK